MKVPFLFRIWWSNFWNVLVKIHNRIDWVHGNGWTIFFWVRRMNANQWENGYFAHHPQITLSYYELWTLYEWWWWWVDKVFFDGQVQYQKNRSTDRTACIVQYIQIATDTWYVIAQRFLYCSFRCFDFDWISKTKRSTLVISVRGSNVLYRINVKNKQLTKRTK